jgi:hypothetical protein
MHGLLLASDLHHRVPQFSDAPRCDPAAVVVNGLAIFQPSQQVLAADGARLDGVPGVLSVRCHVPNLAALRWRTPTSRARHRRRKRQVRAAKWGAEMRITDTADLCCDRPSDVPLCV